MKIQSGNKLDPLKIDYRMLHYTVIYEVMYSLCKLCVQIWYDYIQEKQIP